MNNWEQITLNDISTISSGKSVKYEKELNLTYPVLGSNGQIGTLNDYNFEKGYLLGRVGAAGSVQKITSKVWASDNTLTIKLYDGKTDFNFMEYLLKYLDYGKYATKTAQPLITQSILKQVKFSLPPLKEQQKIAEILSSVDAAIEKTEQVIAKTEEVKKGLMQQLLTKGIGHTEYKDSELGYIPSLWDLSKLSDISHKINDGAHHTPTYTESGVNFLRVTDIKGDTIDWGNTKFISKDEHEVLIKRCNPELGDILLSKNGTIGQVKLIDFDKEFSIFVSLCLIKPNHDLIYNKFLAYYLQTDIVMKQFLKRSKSGTVTNLHLEEIRQVTVPIPPYEEQLLALLVLRQFIGKIYLR